MGIIISSFIGCGREYLNNTHGNKVKIFDAVSSIPLNENDKDSLDTYFNTVMDEVDSNDIVFIGASEKVRGIFNENNIDYDVFYPSKERRGEFIENQVRKRMNPSLIRDLDKNFEEWVQELDDDEAPNCYKHKLSNQGEYIGNAAVIMQYIDSISQRNTNTAVPTNNEEKPQDND